MKSRVLQFLCSVHTIYVALPKWRFFCFVFFVIFFKQGGKEGGDRTKPCKSSLRELHQDLSTEQIREWIYTVTALCSSGPQPWSGHPWGSPRLFLGFQKIKTICITTIRYYLPFLLCWPFALTVPKALVGEIPGTCLESRQWHPLVLVVARVPYYCGLGC